MKRSHSTVPPFAEFHVNNETNMLRHLLKFIANECLNVLLNDPTFVHFEVPNLTLKVEYHKDGSPPCGARNARLISIVLPV